MWANEHRRITKRGIAAATQPFEPSPDERHFNLGARNEYRGSGKQHEGPSVGQPDHLAERLTRLTRLASEPAIEELRAGDRDTIRRHPVVVHGFLLLMLVPDRDHIGHETHMALVGQVVPARYRRDKGHTGRLRCPCDIHLIRRRIDQWRHDHRVRASRLEILANRGTDWNGALPRLKESNHTV